MDYSIILNYLNYCRIHKRLSEHSIRAYRIDLKQFYDFRNSNVKDYVDFLSSTTKKTSTLKRKIASLKSFYRYLEEQELISENPFYKIRFQFRVEKNLPKIIPSFDLEAIYDYLYEEKANAGTPFRIEKSSRNLLITELLISTGLRISELCHITIEDIDVPNRTIKILGKGKKERVTYLGNDHTYTLLLNYIAQYRTNNSGFLFLGHNRHDNLSEQSVRLLFKSVCQKIDLNKSVTPHMFRHTFARVCLFLGENEKSSIERK